MKKSAVIIFVISAFVSAAGCAIIAGKDEALTPAPGQGLRITFVETLRDEASLRGESFREVMTVTDPATTLQRPTSIYADPFRVYVIDTTSPAGPRIFIFDRGERKVTRLCNATLDATTISQFCDATLRTPAPYPRPDEKGLVAPSGIAVDASGAIFVSDAQQGRVFGYDRKGTLLMVIGRLVLLSLPSGLAVDNQRNKLYVADAHGQKVKAFTILGDYLFEIGGSGNPQEDFKFPAAVALDRQGNLYVLDSMRKRVYVFDAAGKFLRAFGLSGDAAGGAVRPKGIAVDSDGHVYVTDTVNNNVMVFAPDGMLLLTMGRTGRIIGDFLTPAGIFIDSQDTIYVADQANGRVQVFQYAK